TSHVSSPIRGRSRKGSNCCQGGQPGVQVSHGGSPNRERTPLSRSCHLKGNCE
ncbi:Uncharacterized protein FKW44_021964, partial [Caligus rogercresseyi]